MIVHKENHKAHFKSVHACYVVIYCIKANVLNLTMYK